jgi:pantothenate kinase type III
MRAIRGDLIVIDFGTATTFDVIDFNGAYKGGIIAPGINLSLDALVGNATAKLPRIAIEAPESERDRPRHRGPDADRRVLGLCRDDGRA